jgi:putative transposase
MTFKKKFQEDRTVLERWQLIRKTSRAMSIRRQCDILQVNRSSHYYRPLGESPENLKIIELMDRHATALPAEGVLSMVNRLSGKGYEVNYKRVGCSGRWGIGHYILRNT